MTYLFDWLTAFRPGNSKQQEVTVTSPAQTGFEHYGSLLATRPACVFRQSQLHSEISLNVIKIAHVIFRI
jgi:hypothetical protein